MFLQIICIKSSPEECKVIQCTWQNYRTSSDMHTPKWTNFITHFALDRLRFIPCVCVCASYFSGIGSISHTKTSHLDGLWNMIERICAQETHRESRQKWPSQSEFWSAILAGERCSSRCVNGWNTKMKHIFIKIFELRLLALCLNKTKRENSSEIRFPPRRELLPPRSFIYPLRNIVILNYYHSIVCYSCVNNDRHMGNGFFKGDFSKVDFSDFDLFVGGSAGVCGFKSFGWSQRDRVTHQNSNHVDRRHFDPMRWEEGPLYLIATMSERKKLTSGVSAIRNKIHEESGKKCRRIWMSLVNGYPFTETIFIRTLLSCYRSKWLLLLLLLWQLQATKYSNKIAAHNFRAHSHGKINRAGKNVRYAS